MQTYKATNGVNSYLKNFADLAAAEAYYLPILGEGFTVSLASSNDQIPEPTAEQIAESQIDNGYRVARDITIEIRKQGKKVNPNLFDIMQHLKFGELDDAITKIQALNVNILSQELKDKYIAEINNYL
jgi:hypothetical protein